MRPIVTYSRILKMYKSRHAGVKALESVKHLMPLYPSKRLAGIVGDMFSDGHLQGHNKWRLDFTSGSTNELKRFEKEFYLQFRVIGKIRDCVTNRFGTTYNYGVNNKPISRILFLCGVPSGNKVLQPTKIPNWILSNKSYFTRFIQRIMDCEGCVDTVNKYVELNMSKSEDLMDNGYELFNNIKKHLLKYYVIQTTNPFTETRYNLRKDGVKTKAIKIKIKRKEAVKRFYKYIGFSNKTKQQKLKAVIASWSWDGN